MPRKMNFKKGADRSFHGDDGGARLREQELLARLARGALESHADRIARLDAADRADVEASAVRLARQAAETRRLLSR